MNNKANFPAIFLLISSSIGTFGASLFWTGFPVYYASTTNTHWSLSGVYSLATLGTLLFTLIGGIWGDSGNYKKLAIQSHFLSFFFILIIFSLNFEATKEYLLLVLPLLYFNFSLGFISESLWLLKSTEVTNYKNRILDRTMLTLVSKLLGFSLGPVLFLSLGKYCLLLCGGAFLITSIIQLILNIRFHTDHPVDKSQPQNSLNMSLKNLALLFSSPTFVLTTFLTGILSIPFNPLFIVHLEKIGSTKDISLFWLTAGLSGFLATLLMRKTKILENNNWFLLITIFMCGFLFNAFNSSNPIVVIIFASLYVFSSIQFTAKTQIMAATTSKSETLGSSIGSVNFLIDAGIFFGMLLGTGASSISIYWMISISCCLLLARWITFAKLNKA